MTVGEPINKIIGVLTVIAAVIIEYCLYPSLVTVYFIYPTQTLSKPFLFLVSQQRKL